MGHLPVRLCCYLSSTVNLKIMFRVWKSKGKIQRKIRSFFYVSLKKGGGEEKIAWKKVTGVSITGFFQLFLLNTYRLPSYRLHFPSDFTTCSFFLE